MAKNIQIKVRPSLFLITQRLHRARKKMGKMRGAHAKIAIFLDQWVQRNFKRQGALVGGWEPLKASTILGRLRKNKRGGGSPAMAGIFKILMDTGRLRASFSPFADDKDAGIGSDLSYSVAHEEGTKHIKIRRMLPKIKEVRPEIMRRYRQHIKESFKPLRST